MNEMVIELVKLESGEIVLRRKGDSQSEPLLKLQFSKEALAMLEGNELDIAQLMVHAGIQGFEQMQEELPSKKDAQPNEFLH